MRMDSTMQDLQEYLNTHRLRLSVTYSERIYFATLRQRGEAVGFQARGDSFTDSLMAVLAKFWAAGFSRPGQEGGI